MVHSAVLAAQTVMGLSPGQNRQCGTHLQVCGIKKASCHADLNTVSRCHTTHESEDQGGGGVENAQKGIHPGFETQGRCH